MSLGATKYSKSFNSQMVNFLQGNFANSNFILSAKNFMQDWLHVYDCNDF